MYFTKYQLTLVGLGVFCLGVVLAAFLAHLGCAPAIQSQVRKNMRV